MSTLDNDRVVATMRAAGMTVDRDNYIAVNWGDPPPRPWTPELESQIPEALQDWDWFQADNTGENESDDDGLELFHAQGDVQFEHPAKGANHCSQCEHFIAPEGCRLVAPPVEPEDWCTLFAAASG